MQTHCPNCKTQFRVTGTQLEAADGYVRCGVCKNIFNVFKPEPQQDNEHEVTGDTFTALDKLQPVTDSQTLTSGEKTDSTVENDEALTSDKKLKEDSLDFFNEEVTESLPHVVPEQLRRKYATEKHSAASTLLWGLGILLLTASLFVEYIWFHRDQYSQAPELNAALELVCRQINCNKVSMRAPSKIELIARNIYTHPNIKQALMVDVTMKNNAVFAQPYPVMNISFSDIRGNEIASRNFYPDEYLSLEQGTESKSRHALLPPGTSASLTLEIRDPGKQATTYEFSFL